MTSSGTNMTGDTNMTSRGTGMTGGSGSNEPRRLSPRELVVLRMTARGMKLKQIAAELHLHRSTVANARTRFFNKLGVSNSAQAIVAAIELGILEVGNE